VLAVPSIFELDVRHIEHVVDYLVMPFREARPFLLDVEGFGPVFEIDVGFEDDKVVDLFRQLPKTNLKPIDFRIDYEKVLDFSLLIALGVWLPSSCLAGVLCVFDW